MNIHQTMQAAYAQWLLIGNGEEKRSAYIRTEGNDAFGNDTRCHFCDYSMAISGEDTLADSACKSCPAAGLWSNNQKDSCMAIGSTYDQWVMGEDPKAIGMINLIKLVAQKHGVELKESNEK